MFIGEYIYLIDEKKRLAIPAKFRKSLGKKAVIAIGLDNCLAVYPIDEWVKMAKKLETLPMSQGDARNFSRIMLSGASDVELDKLGRILVPDYLKKHASLNKNAAILGLGNKIEIWSEDKWKEYKERTQGSVGDIAEKLKEFGV